MGEVAQLVDGGVAADGTFANGGHEGTAIFCAPPTRVGGLMVTKPNGFPAESVTHPGPMLGRANWKLPVCAERSTADGRSPCMRLEMRRSACLEVRVKLEMGRPFLRGV